MEVKAIPYKDVPGMFHLRWDDGVWSKDFYSETWADEHVRRLNETYRVEASHSKAAGCVSTTTLLPTYLTENNAPDRLKTPLKGNLNAI